MGSGFKTFTAGSVLTASDVQNYLQDQAVMVFGGTAARSSAIGTANFEEGMLTYLTDVDKLQVYTGSSFQDVYPPAATSQGMTLINTTSFSAVASQSSGAVFSATYDFYRVILNITAATADAVIRIKMRSGATDSSANYYGAVGNVATNGNYSNSSVGNLTTGWIITEIDTAIASNFNPSATIDFARPFSAVSTNMQILANASDSGGSIYSNFGGGVHYVNTSYDQFNVIASAGNISGKIQVYGYAQ